MQVTHDLAIGGLQQVVVNICRTIDKEGFDILVLCLRDLGEFVPQVKQMGIKVLYLPQKKQGTDYFSFLKVAKIFRREKIDVIHTHNTQPFIDGSIAALLSGVKIIVHTDHARAFPDKKRYMFAEWLMSHFAYKIVGVSEHTSQNLRKYEHISPRKIVTITNGIYGEAYKINLDNGKKRQELGINENGPIIGLCVRLTEQKGITYLLQAMPAIITKIPNITLIIAGDGYLKDKLEEEAVSLKITGNVLFVGPRLDIPELLKLFDLYVLPSLWEGLPMVILEAMAASCPIIATDVGGIKSSIQHGFNGSLVPPKSPEHLSSAIIQILKDENLRQKYIKNGLDTFNTKFTARSMTKQYERIYTRYLIHT